MAKDAKGHGSSGNGGGFQSAARNFADRTRVMAAQKQRAAEFNAHLNDQNYAGMGPAPAHWGDAAAANELSSGTPKSAPAPVHDAMVGVGPNSPLAGSRDYDPFGRPRADKSSYDEATADMRLRGRNGQIGSGMKFRG